MLAAAALSISSSGVALPASSSRALLPSSRAAAASSSRAPLHAEPRLVHAGLEVTAGEKWICNVWVHPVAQPREPPG